MYAIIADHCTVAFPIGHLQYDSTYREREREVIYTDIGERYKRGREGEERGTKLGGNTHK